jgi:hypothetical protein
LVSNNPTSIGLSPISNAHAGASTTTEQGTMSLAKCPRKTANKVICEKSSSYLEINSSYQAFLNFD